jgi:Transglycosylase-like domain
VRIRIALTTAAAVILIPVVLVTVFTSSPAASARATTRHQASGHHRTTLGAMKLMPSAQAEKVATLANFYNAVIAHEQAAYLGALVAAQRAAFYRAVAQHQQEEAAQAAATAAAAAAAAHPAPAPPPAPAPLPAPAAGGSDATSTNTPDWACIRQHESNGDYSVGGGGAYQFELGTWESLTGLTSPAQAYPPAVQDAAALKLFSESGWEPWTTRYVCGL